MNYFYTDNNGKVYRCSWGCTEIVGIDTDTAEFVSINSIKDSDNVFWCDSYDWCIVISDADPETTRAVATSYLADKDYLFYCSTSCEIIQWINTDNFQEIDGVYYKNNDKVFYWYFGELKEVENADPDSFEGIQGWMFNGIDNDAAYYTTHKLANSIPWSFEVLQWWYTKDSQQVYYKDKVVEEVQINSFETIDPLDYVNQEALSTYNNDRYNYAKDNNHVYFEGEVIPGIDVDTFALIDRRTIEDYNGTYKYESNTWNNISEGTTPEPSTDFSCQNAQNIWVSTVECEALMDLYISTNGDNWNNNDGRGTDSWVCEWYGIGCEMNNLIGIQLGENNLDWELPISLVDLKTLERLYLYKNNITWNLPNQRSELNHLKHISIWENKINGELPKNRASRDKIKTFNINNNPIGGELPKERSSRYDTIESFIVRSTDIEWYIPRERIHWEKIMLFSAEKTNIDLGSNHIYPFRCTEPVANCNINKTRTEFLDRISQQPEDNALTMLQDIIDNALDEAEENTSTNQEGSDAIKNCRNKEYNKAHTFAYQNDITTITSCANAQMDNVLSRKHAAKMVTNFATKVMNKQPDTSLNCSFADMQNESSEMKNYATLVCQLWLMGMKSDGKTPATNFNPNQYLNKAQVATIISRIVYTNLPVNEDCWYCSHVDTLQKAWVITNKDDLFTPLKRAYAMIMFMRVVE